MLLISLIAAMAKDRVIGRGTGMPWHVPGDLQRFKRLTMGHCLLMGRKTFESIGRPLPGRRTIVLSHQKTVPMECEVAESLSSALAMAAGEDEIFVCGGADIYRQTIALADRIYLTELDLEVPGDRFFPDIPGETFATLFEECYSEEVTYRFSILQRLAVTEPLSKELKDKI